MRASEINTFDNLLVRSYQKIKAYVCSLCGNWTDAEDITQDAFVRAFKAYDKFDRQCSFESWVMQIARNQYFDTIRRKKRRVATVSMEGLPIEDCSDLNVANSVNDAEDIALAGLFGSATNPLLLELDLAQRQILQWISIDGMTYREAAAQMQIPVRHVKAQHVRALKAARLRYLLSTGIAELSDSTQVPRGQNPVGARHQFA